MQPCGLSIRVQLEAPCKSEGIGFIIHLAALPRRGRVQVRIVRSRSCTGLHDAAEQRARLVEGYFRRCELRAPRNEVPRGVDGSVHRALRPVLDGDEERAGDELGLRRGRDDAAAPPCDVQCWDLLVVWLVRGRRCVRLFGEPGRRDGLDPVVGRHAPFG